MKYPGIEPDPKAPKPLDWHIVVSVTNLIVGILRLLLALADQGRH